MRAAVFIVVPLADVHVDVQLYPTRSGAFAQARDLTVADVRMLPESIRAQWEIEMDLALGTPVDPWCGKAPTSEGHA